MKTKLTLLMAAALLVLPATAADNYFSGVSLGSYGTVNWQKLAGHATTGLGIYAEGPLYKSLHVRLSGESDRWQPNDYYIDRAYVDLIGYLPLNANVSLYGLGGFGYDLGDAKPWKATGERGHSSFGSQRDGEAVLAHAGGGLRAALFKIGLVKTSVFCQGTLWASTTDKHGAGIAGGFNFGW